MSAYCTSCGRAIPDPNKKSCSMCYGDLDYGGCTAYREEMENDALRQYEREQEDQELSEQQDLFNR